MNRLALGFAPLLLGLAACDQVDDIKDTVDGLTNPLVMVGMHLGIETPSSDIIDLSDTDYAEGAQAKVFLFDASSISDLGDSPVEGATVDLVSSSNGGPFTLEDQGSGTYTARGADGLSYTAEEFTVQAGVGDGSHSIDSVSPEAPDADVPENHSAGNPMAISLDGQGYDGALVIVFDAGNGEITWSNEPTTVQDLYTFTHEETSTQVEIEGEAFEQPGVYAVAVAGTVNATDDGMVEVNTALSSLVAGKFRFYPVTVE